MAMELEHSFVVPVPPEQAWDVLLDVQRVAPSMPGATVESVEGDDVTGRLRVKVGPVSLTYRGTARFTERNAAERRVVVEASGKETRGSGTASATVRAALHPHDGTSPDGERHTLVTLHTTLNVTGRPAQFGRGVLAEVGGKLIGQFADNLARQLTGGPAAAAPTTGAADTTTAGDTPPAATASAAGPGSVDAAGSPAAAGDTASAAPTEPPREDAINLLTVAGPAVLKRAVPVLGGVTLLGLLTWWLRRMIRRRRRGASRSD